MPRDMNWTLWIGALLAAYLIGSIPFGLLIARLRGVDIRQHGSGNIGATNVGRVLGKRLGITCFVLDVFKGLVPVLTYGLLAGAAAQLKADSATGPGPALAALAWLAIPAAAVLGHVFPVWLGFRGGKGVATSLGVLLGVFPYLTLPAVVCFVVWGLVMAFFGWVGLASVVAALVLPPLAAVFGWWLGAAPGALLVLSMVTGLLAALVIWRHRSNLQRIWAGTEPKAAWATRWRSNG